LTFTKGSYNYITASGADSRFVFIPNANGKTIEAKSGSFIIAENMIYAGATNTVSLGTASRNWSAVHARMIQSADTLYITPESTLYVDSGSGTSIIFRQGGTEAGRFDTAGKFKIAKGEYPSTDNSLTSGTSSLRWKNIYATDFTGHLVGNADTATEFASTTTVALTGDVTGTSAASKKGWSITTTIGANNHVHDASATWNNRALTISVGGGGAAATADIPATLTGFTNITSQTLIATTKMTIPVKASSYTSSTAGEIWIVA
jgi:hypothetical protein